MKKHKLARYFVLAFGLSLILTSIVWFGVPTAVFAQKQTGRIQVDPQVDKADPDPPKSLSTRVVMVSILREGTVVKQKELGMSDVPASFTLPVGVYEVRVEGDGVNSVTKSGIHVTADDVTNVLPAMRSGQGVCDCKYSK